MLCHFRGTFTEIFFKQYQVFCKSSFLSGQLSNTHFLKNLKNVLEAKFTLGQLLCDKTCFLFFLPLSISYLLFSDVPHTDLWWGESWFSTRTLRLFPNNERIIFKENKHIPYFFFFWLTHFSSFPWYRKKKIVFSNSQFFLCNFLKCSIFTKG